MIKFRYKRKVSNEGDSSKHPKDNIPSNQTANDIKEINNTTSKLDVDSTTYNNNKQLTNVDQQLEACVQAAIVVSLNCK